MLVLIGLGIQLRTVKNMSNQNKHTIDLVIYTVWNVITLYPEAQLRNPK